jgi:hypothetical protein
MRYTEDAVTVECAIPAVLPAHTGKARSDVTMAVPTSQPPRNSRNRLETVAQACQLAHASQKDAPSAQPLRVEKNAPPDGHSTPNMSYEMIRFRDKQLKISFPGFANF